MLSKALCSDIIAKAMSTGADFAEVYQEQPAPKDAP